MPVADFFLDAARYVTFCCEKGIRDCGERTGATQPCRYALRPHSPAYVLTLAGQLDVDAIEPVAGSEDLGCNQGSAITREGGAGCSL